MASASISIQVDAEAAKAFSQASEPEKRKLEMLLNMRLRELTLEPKRGLQEVMDEMAAKAKARGLTPEALERLLNES
jgi:hypothetical protein